MTAGVTRTQIQRLIALLSQAGALRRANAAVTTHVGKLTRVGWEPRPVPPSSLWMHDHVTIGEYCDVLRSGDYTCLLFDGAVIQIEYTFHGAQLIKHRLCWIPCPVQLPSAAILVDSEFPDLVDDLLSSWAGRRPESDPLSESLPPYLLVGPIRFDYDRHAQAPGHPASHLTIARQCCRVPVFGPLSVAHFARTLFEHFYPTIWSDVEDLRQWTVDHDTRCITSDEEEVMHLEWRARSARPPASQPS